MSELQEVRQLLAQLIDRLPPRGRDFLVRESEVCERIKVGVSTLSILVKEGKFPQPVRTRPNRAWRSSQVDRWIATLAEQELSRPA